MTRFSPARVMSAGVALFAAGALVAMALAPGRWTGSDTWTLLVAAAILWHGVFTLRGLYLAQRTP
jgi:hypothetical protein